MLQPKISRRKASKRNQYRQSNKTRDIATNVGKLCQRPPVYNGFAGMTYSGPGYPEFGKRTKAETAYECYYAAKRSQYCRTLAGGFTELYGSEEINGTVNNRSGMNNVVHIKLEAVNLPYLCLHEYKGRYYYEDYFRCGCYTTLDKSQFLRTSALAEEFQPGNDPFFSGRAYWSMRPRFEGDVSIINSIFELKDFKDILKIGKIAERLRNTLTDRRYSKAQRDTYSAIAQYGNDLTLPTLKKLAKDTSGAAAAALLAWNLAIKPTVADALAICAQFGTTVSDAEKEFASMGDDGALSHFSENFVLQIPSYVPRAPDNYWGIGAYKKVVRTATMRSFYQYKARNMTDALVKYWGLAGTVEAVWNMLPLSFVLDYVFTVGKALSYMNRDDNVLNLHTEYCESVKIECSYGHHIIQSSLTPGLIIDGSWKIPTSKQKYHIISGTRCKRYARQVMDPYCGPALPKIKLPSTTQGLNCLALARVFIK